MYCKYLVLGFSWVQEGKRIQCKTYSIKKKKNLQKIYKEALYRTFVESEAIMVSYPKSNDTRSKMTLWNFNQKNVNG